MKQWYALCVFSYSYSYASILEVHSSGDFSDGLSHILLLHHYLTLLSMTKILASHVCGSNQSIIYSKWWILCKQLFNFYDLWYKRWQKERFSIPPPATASSIHEYSGFRFVLTHWGRVTHICVSKLTIIGSDNGLSPDRRQAIIWTNAGLLLIGPLGTNVSEILIEILTFSFKKMRLKVSSAKRRPFCLGLNVLTVVLHLTACIDSIHAANCEIAK